MTLEPTPPERDPDLSDVWDEMQPSERLGYLMHDGELVPPAVSESVWQMYRDLQEQPGREGNSA
ncbi:hypothetical protein FH608_050780 [Nonomuraea phyllanthi]|uniref:Uncharacterized protein n=1 Tax=Nonomuraea phyllanthi TaxID=2219224 RepID=A0A5C4USD9_9ACTN|nr:hypothetical protein [Nonomuraea phyllanthi]KAB8181807.1 hypothetical protein FH608_050780 [Nonomuraea phyllanthi]QFY08007.1 hypothetical protein GBF35_16170 [Nonomuraea phyllanthi]